MKEGTRVLIALALAIAAGALIAASGNATCGKSTETIKPVSTFTSDLGSSMSPIIGYFGGSTLIVAVGPTPAVRIHIGSFPDPS